MSEGIDQAIEADKSAKQMSGTSVSPILQRARTVLVTQQYCGKEEYEGSLSNFFQTFGDNEESRDALKQAEFLRSDELRRELPTAAKTAAYSVLHPEGINDSSKQRISDANRGNFLRRYSPIRREAESALNEEISALSR